MALPTCECVSGKPIGEQLTAIFCALLQIIQSGGGGSVNINDVEGDFWKAALGETPAANQVFGTDGSAVFTTFDISDVGIVVLGAEAPVGTGVLIISTGPTVIYREGITNELGPVTAIGVQDGVVTAIS
jgi:hypothetical protein